MKSRHGVSSAIENPRVHLLDAAVAENAEWCALVCRLHGIESVTTSGCWTACAPTPPYYPAVVTLRPGLAPSAIPQPAASFAVKDSYADIDLAALGYQLLFSACWIVASPRRGDSGPWRPLASASELTSWRAAHGSSEGLHPGLVDEPGVTILCKGTRNDISAGAVLHRTKDVIGVSNVFGDADWRALAAAAVGRYGARPVIGYQSGDALANARTSGWADLGPLRVWLSPAQRPKLALPAGS